MDSSAGSLGLRSGMIVDIFQMAGIWLFTPDTHEANIHPPVIVDGKLVRLEKHPVLLGVMFDTMYTV